jgi:two-component system chemotaxis sensor kinase CheA
MDEVRESFLPQGVKRIAISESEEIIIRRDVVYSLVRLAELFGRPADRGPVEKGIFIVLELKQTKEVLLVDDIEGTRQVVVKDLEGIRQNSDLFVGAALRGDQRIAMILDTTKLVAGTEDVDGRRTVVEPPPSAEPPVSPASSPVLRAA